ncbi:hypothetical protein O181_001622 [Austropuccinia psidii MF-1]|uniref:Integrase catalytic domain-containing protein n=1 Tax=Austropuccinia psidii MF-1 TaxID=1389203 RepID=A0A9Q3GD83_9BASI|nr:hypothetical protein [Austropuccinia psidii MF-1]
MNFQQLIKQDKVKPSRLFSVKVEDFSNFIESIQKALWKDSQYRSTLKDLGKVKVVENHSLDPSSNLLLQVLGGGPNDPTIQLSIPQNSHDSLAGHLGQEKTLKLVKQDLHWSIMTQLIKDYFSSCQQCSRNNNIHHKKFGLLKALPIPNSFWICLSMELITKLPLLNTFDSILVIVDRFSKMAVFIPTMSSMNSLDFSHLLIKNNFSKHGLPSSIVSDRVSFFVSSFWSNLCQKLKISRDLSTAYHTKTDGQTEKVNQILKQYLWMYVSYPQDHWNTWLPMAEFAYNNSDHSSIKQSPFFTFYGRYPQLNSLHINQDTPSGKLSTKLQSVQQDVKRELEVAINSFKMYADKSRARPPVFNLGDMVWLSSKNIKSTRPTKMVGSFSNLEESWHSFLPSKWKSIHPVFHISI